MIGTVADQLPLRLVPDELWALVEPLIPRFRPRPQGGGTAPLDDRAVFTAIVYVLASGCAWRICRRRSGCRSRPRTAGLGSGRVRACGGGCTGRCWMSWVPGGAGLDVGDRGCGGGAGEKGGTLAGPNPVDRGKGGSKLHVLSEAQGIPQPLPRLPWPCRRTDLLQETRQASHVRRAVNASVQEATCGHGGRYATILLKGVLSTLPGDSPARVESFRLAI